MISKEKGECTGSLRLIVITVTTSVSLNLGPSVQGRQARAGGGELSFWGFSQRVTLVGREVLICRKILRRMWLFQQKKKLLSSAGY